jgi:2-polyprenyl-6-methoxyphenol hydroxylase-like FAD-dependent oxidoreductase
MSIANGQTAKDAQVIITGGGPVGMGLAIELGQRGIRCVVVERRRTPQPIPKGQNLTQRTMEHFHFWGVEQAVRGARTIPREYGIGGLTAYGTLLGDYSYDWLQRELVRPFYFMDNERLPQYAMEAALRGRVAELASVQTLYGWSAEDVSQDDHGAQVAIKGLDGNNRRTLRADYAVGCDGSRSTVRERGGITQTLSDHDRLMVLLVFRSQGLHRLLERYPGKSYYNVLHPDLEGYWKFFGRVDLGSTWFFHAPVPPGTTRDNFDFRQYLHAAVGTEFDVDVDYVGFWDLRFAIADSYRNKRIFIAGDAAHSHPPYGGYGINLGLEDAKNLGWKLAAVLQGWAGPKLLESYDEERRPVFQSTARDFIARAIETDRKFLAAFSPERDRAAFEREWQARQSGARAEINAFEPNYEGSPITCGPPGGTSSALGSHAFTARAGHHLSPHRLPSGRNVFEELGSGLTLLHFNADSTICTAFETAAQAHGIPLKVVRDDSSASRARYQATHVLVRPDQFVAWASGEASVDAADILRKAIGAG